MWPVAEELPEIVRVAVTELIQVRKQGVATTLMSVMSVAVEVPENVLALAIVLVAKPETVVALCLGVVSVTDEVHEIAQVPVTVLVQVRR